MWLYTKCQKLLWHFPWILRHCTLYLLHFYTSDYVKEFFRTKIQFIYMTFILIIHKIQIFTQVLNLTPYSFIGGILRNSQHAADYIEIDLEIIWTAQTCAQMYKLDQICTNLLKIFISWWKIYSNLFKHVHHCIDLYKYVQICLHFSKFHQTVQTCSICTSLYIIYKVRT